jgi:hypothetical protein
MPTEQTVNSILTQRRKEVESYCKNFAVAHAKIQEMNGASLKVWLINTNELAMGSKIHFGITGNAHISQGQPQAVSSGGGVLISKNSKLAEYIIKKPVDFFQIPSPTGIKNLKLNTVTTYVPDLSNEKAHDVKGWEPLGEDWWLSVIPRERVSAPDESQEEEAILDVFDAEESIIETNDVVPIDEQNALVIISEEFLEEDNIPVHLNRYVSETAELKYQPILDPWQEEYKRNNFFNGTTAILDGGPGTGKTTTLIQRIKFLIDDAALQDYSDHLNQNQKNHLSHAATNWVFYTPNELLKLFLKESMVREGLLANDMTVRVWQSERSAVMKLFGLINPGNASTSSRLLHQRNSTPCYRYEQARVNELLSVSQTEIVKSVREDLNSKLDKLLVEAPGRDCVQMIERFRVVLSELKTNTFQSLCSTLNIISVGIVGDQLKDLRDDYKKELAKFIQLNKHLLNDTEFVEQLYIVYCEAKNIDVDERILPRFLGELRLNGDSPTQPQRFFQSLAIQSVNAAEDGLDGLLMSFVDSDDKKTMRNELKAKGVFLNKSSQLIKNAFSLLLSQWIPDAFISFKKSTLEMEASFYMNNYAASIKDFKKKQLHNEEQSLLISLLNRIVDIIKINGYMSPQQKEQSKIYSNSIAKRKTVIAIDEVTDLHPIDVAAIYSFKDSYLSSVTLCGDLAQRLTSVGLRRWEDLSGVIGRMHVNELQMSYRQGPKVLEIAEDIYRKATERDHEFVSYFKSSDEEPDPLFKRVTSKSNEVEWLVKRILEIYRAHGNKIPSIAIFVPDESDVNQTSERINDFQELVELDIKCVPCNQGQALGDANSLRVFSIDYIKGLEFEAVFFLNIDKVLSIRGRRIGLRLIYVGLSRAAFYLGITSFEPLDSLRLSEGFKEVSNW